MLKTTIMLVSVGAVGTSLLGSRLVAGTPSPDRKESNLSVSVANASRLEVKIPLGKVTVIADDSREMRVHVVRTAKGTLDESARRWMNDSYLTADNKNGVLTVVDHPFGNERLSNVKSSGNDRNQTHRTLDLDVQIHVPSALAAKVNISAGEADLGGRFRSVDAEVSAGTLSADRIRTDGTLSLKVGAGSLFAGISSGSRATGHLSVGAGEVKLRIPGGSGADVSADVAIGEITGLPGKAHKEDGIHLGDHRHGRTGSGEAKVSIHVGAGNIAVDSEGRVEASTMPEEVGETLAEVKEGDSDLDIKIDSDLNKTIAEAMASANSAMASADVDLKIDLKDLKGLDELKELKELNELKSLESLKDLDVDSKDMHFEFSDDGNGKHSAEQLKKAHAEIERAMKMAAESLKKMRPEIERQMRASKPEMERAMKEAQEEVAKAMKQMRPEIERAMKEAREEMARSSKEMKNIKPEIERAIREALEELKKALKEIKSEEKAKA